jgi:hypothetical protein
MSAYVEIPVEVTAQHVEAAYQQAIKMQQLRNRRWAEIGWRAAQARDEKLLKVLEKASEILSRMDEEQRGRTRRAADKFSEQVETTETQLFREAYNTMDRGNPVENLIWIYGAAAWICGYNCS